MAHLVSALSHCYGHGIFNQCDRCEFKSGMLWFSPGLCPVSSHPNARHRHIGEIFLSSQVVVLYRKTDCLTNSSVALGLNYIQIMFVFS